MWVIIIAIVGIALLSRLKRKNTHDAKDFKIRFRESWFSDKYAVIQYTANGGRSWRNIQKAQEPITDDYNWELDDLTIKVECAGDYWRKRFGSYQKILDFESFERFKVKRGSEEIKERQYRFENLKKELYK